MNAAATSATKRRNANVEIPIARKPARQGKSDEVLDKILKEHADVLKRLADR